MAHMTRADVVNKMIMVRPVFGLACAYCDIGKSLYSGKTAASEGRKDQPAKDVLIDGSAVTWPPVPATLRLVSQA